MIKKPTVSVCMITYNHENYIEEAINGVLMQLCNFEIELIIANDCSLDKTDEVIQNIIQNHPNRSWIKYTRHQQNLGMMPNFIWTLNECKSKYIAICEGDDYWTDRIKLQKQVDFLEKNEEFGICFHNVKIFEQETGKLLEDTITRDVNDTSDITELAKGNYIHTPSVMLRNDFIIPIWFSKSPIGDLVLYMLSIKDKKVKKLDAIMAVYRIHSSNMWSNKSKENRIANTIKSIKLLINSKELNSEINIILKLKVNELKKGLPKKVNFLDRILNKIKIFF